MKILLIGLFALLVHITSYAQQLTSSKRTTVRTVLVETSCADLRSAIELSKLLEQRGVQISVIVSPKAVLGWIKGTVPDLSDVLEIENLYHELGQLPLEKVNDPDLRIAQLYFKRALNGELEKTMEKSSGKMDWNHITHPHSFDRDSEDGQKSGGSALPDWTCGDGYNSEIMEGCILASTFFSESDGTIDADEYTWTQAAIDDVKLQIIDAWSIWTYSASLYGTSIIAVMNWYDNTSTIANTSYEPIRHSSGQDYLWINEHMNDLGYTSSSKFTNVDSFNYDQRQAIGADHSFSCFMIYNPSGAGAPTSMVGGAIGYAYLGGPYTQMLYKANGWNTSQVYRVYGHEIGHIFHAFDEYSSSPSGNCTRAFNGVVNSNYQGSPCNGSQSCVMISNSHTGSGATRRWNMCDHTPDHLGWEFTIPEPILVEPFFNEILTSLPAHLEWDRDTVISGTYGYLKLWDRSNDSLILCQFVNSDTLDLDLLNGDYKWRVSAGGGYGGVVSDTSYFTINAALVADFNRSPVWPCIGEDVNYTDLSSGLPNYWEWHFPGGIPNMYIGQDPPMIVYSAAGTFDVILIVNDSGGGVDTLELTDAVTIIGGDPLPIEEEFEARFPPNGWWAAAGQGPPDNAQWDTITTGTSGFGTSSYFDNFNDTSGFGWGLLSTLQIDMTIGDRAFLVFDVAYAFAGVDSADALSVQINNCNQSLYSSVYLKAGDSLSTNGGVLVSDSLWYPTAVSDWRTDSIDLTQYLGSVLQFKFINQGSGGQAIYLDNVNIKARRDWKMELKVFLEGSYDDISGLMKDDLRINGLVPLTEPYSALGYGFIGGGGESIVPAVLAVAGPTAIVDWVVVELRDKENPSMVIASRAGLLRRDGSVVDMDGITFVTFNNIWTDWYHVAIRHRSHLGIMLALGNYSTANELIDLTSGFPPTWPIFSDSRKDVNGTYVMWAGDVNFDGVIKYTGPNNDRDQILTNIGGTVPTNTNTGYYGTDVNMDSDVKYTGSENDRDIILQNIGGSVPTAIRQEQLP